MPHKITDGDVCAMLLSVVQTAERLMAVTDDAMNTYVEHNPMVWIATIKGRAPTKVTCSFHNGRSVVRTVM